MLNKLNGQPQYRKHSGGGVVISSLLAGLILVGGSATAQSQEKDAPFIDRSPSGHIEAILPNAGIKEAWYDGRYKFAPAVRAGDFIYFSGTVAGAFDGKTPIGEEAFKADIRRRFESLGETLKAAGASFDDVIKITTFHVFDSPHISLDKVAQINAVADVKAEFIRAPHPAWTAIGTTALFSDLGLVEIEIVAYAPRPKTGSK